MFFFISYRLPNTSDFVSVAFSYSIDRMAKSVLSLINETFPALGLTGDDLFESGYISDKPMKGEDIWRKIGLDGEIEKW